MIAGAFLAGFSLAVAAAAPSAPSAPAPAARAPNSALAKCRALDKEFDTKNMPKPCQAAADDATLPIAERVEALRFLAQAHILNGDEALAEPAFMKMLVFSPTAELPGDAGPRIREIFSAVKQRFDEEGVLGVTFVPPPQPASGAPVELQVDVVDKLGRAIGARVRTQSSAQTEPVEERLVRNELSPGNLRFTGRVPEPKGPLPPEGATLKYEVVVETWDGQALPLPAPVTGAFTRTGGAVVGEPVVEEPPWTLIGLGVGGGVLVAGAVTAGVVYCFTAGSCRTQEAWVRVQIQPGVQE